MTGEIHTVDSHTAGEPTRIVLSGGPPLGHGPLSERLTIFRTKHDAYRRAIITEPRGSDVLVGGLLCEPYDPSCQAGVIFFNNIGFLGMCGHGLIGLVETLRDQGKLDVGQTHIETPVGKVAATLHKDGDVSVSNVESYRIAKDVEVHTKGFGIVRGDVAYGGNWFFLTNTPEHKIARSEIGKLTAMACAIRQAINEAGYPEVDHVEIFGPPEGEADSRNFVLCPGLEYDRSPCGTGTSAKLACLAADAKLAPNQSWIQQGVLGTSFTCDYSWADTSKERIKPTVRGRAFITAETRLRLTPKDPFCWGIQ
jgi:4-hydroxyproline epimerase